MSNCVLAFDFGGTKLAAGLVETKQGAVLCHYQEPTPQGGADASLAIMLAWGQRLLAESPQAVVGAGVNFGGPVDSRRGIILESHHVAGWNNRPLAQELEEKLHLPTAVDNDANGQALAEWRYGVGSGTRSFIFINLGTGLGGGIIIDGHLWHGAHGLAGEFGHFPLHPDGPLCSCGRRGCFEALCAGPALQRRLEEALTHERSPVRLTLAELWTAAEAGVPIAKRVAGAIFEDLAHGLAIIQLSFDPELIALGGGAARYTASQLQDIQQRARSYVLPVVSPYLHIAHATLGAESGLLGAAAIFLNQARDGHA
ncbi:MAG: ROK family protein [Chloroflexi bacterium]|nr:ROK family protein [Chloroflexota bacterium]